ncbi:MAG: DMT family transporter [Proteobacteria bacterium]|jgi:drug/metabolite transporter (DMT)-like permease|nr:DMT family transporter [Pseudomonadota bacterium]
MSVFIWGLLLLLCFVWSLSFLLAEILLESVRPFTIVFNRVFFASIVMVILIKLLGKRFPASRKNIFLLFLLGLTNNAIPFSAIVYGQQFITGGLASIINTNTAFFTLILSSMMFVDERLTMIRLLGIILGITGVIIAIGPSELLSLSVDNLGQQCIILATLCYAISTTMARKFIKGVDPLVSVTVMLLSSAFWMGIIVLYMEGLPLFTPSTVNIISIGLLAVLSTSLAYILYFMLLERAGAGTTTLVTVLIPPFAMIMDAIILKEEITSPQVAGFMFVAVGVVMVARGLPKQTTN